MREFEGVVGFAEGRDGASGRRPLVVVPRVRHELKYVVPAELADDIREYASIFCRADPNAVGDPPGYTVSTLQLDSPSLALHFAKEHKQVNRFKLRVRHYGERPEGTLFFEVKRKEDAYVRKTRSRVDASEYGDWLYRSGGRLPRFKNEEEHMNHLEFMRLSDAIGAKPALHIRYFRESWIGKDDKSVRVTMDRNLRYRMAEGYRLFNDEDRGWRVMDSETGLRRAYGGMILEIKSSLEVPTWVLRMIRHFGFERSGFCKYSTAMRLESLFGGSVYSATSERCGF